MDTVTHTIFDLEPVTLADFKRALPIGQKLRLVKAWRKFHPDKLTPDLNHKQLGVLREVAEKRGKDIVMRILEGEKAGVMGYLAWPKAPQLEILRDDARGFYGFKINDGDFGVALEYAFEPAAPDVAEGAHNHD